MTAAGRSSGELLFVFRSGSDDDLLGFSRCQAPDVLPAELGPWRQQGSMPVETAVAGSTFAGSVVAHVNRRNYCIVDVVTLEIVLG